MSVERIGRRFVIASSQDVTTLVLGARRQGKAALDALFPIVYEELRRRAHACLLGEARDHTLSTTDLVHETYLKLVDIERVEWQDRAHFLAVSARAMRRVLVSYARKHRAIKRGGAPTRVALDDALLLAHQRSSELLALDEALERLAKLRPRWAETVEFRFFGGMTIRETSEVLGVAENTVVLDWSKAKAWLYRELEP